MCRVVVEEDAVRERIRPDEKVHDPCADKVGPGMEPTIHWWEGFGGVNEDRKKLVIIRWKGWCLQVLDAITCPACQWRYRSYAEELTV